ncbi:MAG: glucose 1-dehydrogenase [Spirochaetes bacterium]|nr:glucose 1-dehydrogenase [Spirochaetota bacterium]
MSGEFEGKVALVTGAASGIGRAAAHAFAREGAKVTVADINAEGGEETVSHIKESGGEAIFVKTDVSKSDQVKALIDKTVETFGRLDYAFNNAGLGVGIGIPTADFTEEDWDLTHSINLKGVWLCMKYELIQMLKQGTKAAIVNTASISGLAAHPADPAYVSSKFGCVGLTKTAGLEYAKTNVRINCVCPGPVKTGLMDRVEKAIPGSAAKAKDEVPMDRVGQPEEVAEAVIWLCSDKASFVTAVAMPVDGGEAAL